MKNLFISLLLLSCIKETYAQVGIKANNTPPIASAQLEVQSINKAFYPPRMTSQQRTSFPNAPVAGAVVYDTDLGGLYFYNGSAWLSASGATLSLPYSASQNVSDNNMLYIGNTNTSTGSSTIYGETNSSTSEVAGIAGYASNNSPTGKSVGVKGINLSNNSFGSGIYGRHNGSGIAVEGYSFFGTGGYFTAGSSSGYALITGTGKVGIGVSTPNQFMDVNGRMRIYNSTFGTAGLWFNNSTNSLSGGDGSFYGMKLDTETGIFMGGTWRFWVNNSGNATITGLAGTGNRPVLADANGTLTAVASNQSIYLQASDFQPLSGYSSVIRYENSLSFTGIGILVAPINLPVGAKINSITFRVKDNSSTGMMAYSLETTNTNNNTPSQLSSGSSTIASMNASPINYISTSSLPITTQSSNYYYISLGAYDNVGNLISWSSGATFSLLWVQINYTY